ncbi:MAG: transglutaminase family protein [Polyangiaceae bacterium]
MVGRLPYAPCALAFATVLASTPSARSAPNDLESPSSPSATALRWTDETPDAMVDDATARALRPTATVRDDLAALSTIATLASRATDEHASKALARIAADSGGKPGDVRGEAALLGRMLANDDGTDSGAEQDERLGIIDALSILGPFRDTGGGLDARDGPEAPDATFGDTRARYSWGTYEVAWRSVPRAFAPARGVALDLFVFPRKESCTWIATKLTVASKQSLFLRLAATGQARLVFDGTDVGRDDAVHEVLRFDRIAARVRAEAGAHLLAAKVCSGALDDDGRVRLRVTDQNGSPPHDVTASADLSGQGARPSRGPAPAFDLVATPLGRALEQPGTGRDASIGAALLRTLGGADDLRSPRAPGLLAAFTDGDIDADALAMAAWITPSGANRSAWLNRVRSSPSADARTRAFVERRLVERHLEAGLPDWAMATLLAANIDAAHDAEAAVLASRVDSALGTDALRVRAERRLAAFARAATNAPDALLDSLADLAIADDPALASETRERLAERGENGAALVLSLQSRGRDAVVSAARRAFAGGVDNADEALSVAQTVAHAGAHEEARTLYGKLARWAPNHAGVWAGLAEETGAAQGDATRNEAIAAALRRARELDPGEARYRAELSLRTRTPPSGEPHDDDKYLVSPQAFLARRRGGEREDPVGATLLATGHEPLATTPASAPRIGNDGALPRGREAAPPDVADRELHWMRAVVMHADRRVSELVQYAREIEISPRTEDELYEDVPAEGDLTEIVRARVYRRDGEIAFPIEESSDNARPRIRWPDLGPGDVVEVAFRSWTAGPVGGRGDPPFYRLDYAGSQSTHPVLHNEVIVESPADRPIYVDVVNGSADHREDTDEGSHHVVRLVWDRPVNVPDEPLAPPLSEIIPTAVLSTFKDWRAFRDWYGEAVRGFTDPDAQVRELAAKLTRGKSSRDEKLRALFDFVADDIRYVNYVSGEWWLPNRPQQLLARREGDCDDKALLLITLLRAVGIRAQEVLVQTRLTAEPSLLRAAGAAIPLFDHGIAYLPGPEGGTFLDATSPQSRLGPLPSMDARATALRMDGPAEVVLLPSSSPSDHGVDSTWTIALRPDGSADLDGEERASGDDAFWLRTYLTEQGARAPWVEDHLVGPWFPTVEIDKKVEFRGELPHGKAVVQWRATSSGLGRHEGNELVVPLSPSQTIASQLAPLVNRTLPVWLPPSVAPRSEARTIRVIAPKNWTFAALPAGGDENGGPFGRAHLDVTRDPRQPNAILIHRTVVFDQSAIAVEQYPPWRQWIQRVDALMHRSVRLVAATGGAR